MTDGRVDVTIRKALL